MHSCRNLATSQSVCFLTSIAYVPNDSRVAMAPMTALPSRPDKSSNPEESFHSVSIVKTARIELRRTSQVEFDSDPQLRPPPPAIHCTVLVSLGKQRRIIERRP